MTIKTKITNDTRSKKFTSTRSCRTILVWPVLILLLSLLESCEQTVSTPDLPYVEQLVISAFIYADSSQIAVNVSRSLPLNEEFTFEKAAVPDADVSIETPEGTLHLPFDSIRYQYRIDYATAKSGSHYALTVRWHGRTATASTLIPDGPIVDSISYVIEFPDSVHERVNYHSTAYFQANPLAAFATSSVIYGMAERDTLLADSFYLNYRGLPNFSSVIAGTESDSGVVMRIRGNNAIGEPDGSRFLMTKFAALDLAYYDFYKTFRNTREGSVLGSFGTNPLYNIKGDAIGVFIGVSKSTRWYVTQVK